VYSDALPPIEYAVDIWDLAGTDGKPDAEELHEHLRARGRRPQTRPAPVS
jgi:hypothetical protein